MIELCNPVTYIKREKIASDPVGLTGKRVAFLSNNKPNVDLLFDNLVESVSAQFGPRSIIREKKATASLAAPETVLKRLVEEAEVVINGVGD